MTGPKSKYGVMICMNAQKFKIWIGLMYLKKSLDVGQRIFGIEKP